MYYIQQNIQGGKVLQLQEKHLSLEKFRSLAVAKCPLVLNDNVHALILQNIATQENFRGTAKTVKTFPLKCFAIYSML